VDLETEAMVMSPQHCLVDLGPLQSLAVSWLAYGIITRHDRVLGKTPD